MEGLSFSRIYLGDSGLERLNFSRNFFWGGHCLGEIEFFQEFVGILAWRDCIFLGDCWDSVLEGLNFNFSRSLLEYWLGGIAFLGVALAQRLNAALGTGRRFQELLVLDKRE